MPAYTIADIAGQLPPLAPARERPGNCVRSYPSTPPIQRQAEIFVGGALNQANALVQTSHTCEIEFGGTHRVHGDAGGGKRQRRPEQMDLARDQHDRAQTAAAEERPGVYRAVARAQ